MEAQEENGNTHTTLEQNQTEDRGECRLRSCLGGHTGRRLREAWGTLRGYVAFRFAPGAEAEGAALNRKDYPTS